MNQTRQKAFRKKCSVFAATTIILDRFHLHGIVPYDQLPNFFARANVFVGMGTAMLEASASGLPAICAVIADTEGKTYGFAWHQAPGCVGERLLSRAPDQYVLSLLKDVLDSGPKEYEQLVHKVKQCVQPYLLDQQMEKFLSICESSVSGSRDIQASRTSYALRKAYTWILRRVKAFFKLARNT